MSESKMIPLYENIVNSCNAAIKEIESIGPCDFYALFQLRDISDEITEWIEDSKALTYEEDHIHYYNSRGYCEVCGEHMRGD